MEELYYAGTTNFLQLACTKGGKEVIKAIILAAVVGMVLSISLFAKSKHYDTMTTDQHMKQYVKWKLERGDSK